MPGNLLGAGAASASKPFGAYTRRVNAGALGAAAVYAGANAIPVASEHNARATDYMNSKQHDLTAAMPDMKVKSASEAAMNRFANEKLASLGTEGLLAKVALDPLYADPMMSYSPFAPKFQDIGTKALGDAIADIGIKQPVYALQGLVKKKLYTEPKQRSVYYEVMTGDPELTRALQEKPLQMDRMYKTFKTYAPSLTTDHNALRNFMMQGLQTHGEVDPAGIKFLADTESAIRKSRGEIR